MPAASKHAAAAEAVRRSTGGGLDFLLRSGKLRSKPAADVWHSPSARPRERSAPGSAGGQQRGGATTTKVGQRGAAATRGRSTSGRWCKGAGGRGRSQSRGVSQCDGQRGGSAAARRGNGRGAPRGSRGAGGRAHSTAAPGRRRSAAATAASLNPRPATGDDELDGVLQRFDADATRAKAAGFSDAPWRPKLTAARKGRAGNRRSTGAAARHRAALKSAELKLGAWNCWGLSAERLDYIVGSQDGKHPGLGFDAVAVSEGHGGEQKLSDAWGDSGRIFTGGPTVKGDEASGVSWLLSARMAKAVTQSGRPRPGKCESHIVWIRAETDVAPLYLVNTYVPHAGRSNPSCDDVLDELELILQTFPTSAIVVVCGDLNGRLGRSYDWGKPDGEKVNGGVTGPWSVHDSDNEQGAKIRRLCEERDLVASSTFFKPRRKYGGAGTFKPIGKKSHLAVANLDYLLVSQRWQRCVISCRVKWAPSEHRWSSKNGVRKDHGLLEARMRLRLPKVEKVHRPDRKYWKTDDGRAAVKHAVEVSAAKYDSAWLSPCEPLPAVSGSATRTPAPDLAAAAVAVREAMERIFVEAVQAPAGATAPAELAADTDAAASEPELEAETQAEAGELLEDCVWQAMRDSGEDPGGAQILELLLDDDPDMPSQPTTTGMPLETVAPMSLPPIVQPPHDIRHRRRRLDDLVRKLSTAALAVTADGTSQAPHHSELAGCEVLRGGGIWTLADSGMDHPGSDSHMSPPLDEDPVGASVHGLASDVASLQRHAAEVSLRSAGMFAASEGVQSRLQQQEAEQLMIDDSLSTVFANWDLSDESPLREAAERRATSYFDHLQAPSDSNPTISAQRASQPLSLEELSLEIGWRQLYDEHVGSDVIETSAEPEMGAPVSRRLIESDDAGDETLGNAPNMPNSLDSAPDTMGDNTGNELTSDVAARRKRLDDSVTRFQSVCKATLALLPADKGKRKAYFFSISEETRAIKRRHQAEAARCPKTLDRRKADSREYNDSIRNDYRRWCEALLAEVQQLDDAGNVAAVGKLFDRLARRRKGSRQQPTKDAKTGVLYPGEDEALKDWKTYMSEHFTPDDAEHSDLFLDLGEPEPDDQLLLEADLERGLAILKESRAVGDDETPVELIQNSPELKSELFRIVREIWALEYAPEVLAIGLFIMIWKGPAKGSSDEHKNYRPIDLQNHAWKLVGVLLLLRLIEETELFLPEDQAGFRAERGGRDVLLRARLAIERFHGFGVRGWMLLQDYRSAFDSMRHSAMEAALKRAGAKRKSVAMFRLICKMAVGVVTVRRANGSMAKSEKFDIDAGVIQGGMDSPWNFLVGMACLLLDADPLRRSLDYDIRQGVQLLRRGQQPSKTGKFFEDFEAAKAKFLAVEGDAVLETAEEKNFVFESAWFDAVKKGAGRLHAAINSAKSAFERKRAELAEAPEDRPAGWTAADGDDWREELEERRLLKKGFHPGSVRLPRGTVPQCVICDAAWPVPGYCSACAELGFTPPEGHWQRIRREQEAAGGHGDSDAAAVRALMRDMADVGSQSDESSQEDDGSDDTPPRPVRRNPRRDVRVERNLREREDSPTHQVGDSEEDDPVGAPPGPPRRSRLIRRLALRVNTRRTGMGFHMPRGAYADDVSVWEQAAEVGQQRLQAIADESDTAFGLLAAPEKYDALPIAPLDDVGPTTPADAANMPELKVCPNQGCGRCFAAERGLLVHLRKCTRGDGELETSPEGDEHHDVFALLRVRGASGLYRYWQVHWSGEDSEGNFLYPPPDGPGDGTSDYGWQPEYMLGEGLGPLRDAFWRSRRDLDRRGLCEGPPDEIRCIWCNMIFQSRAALKGHQNLTNKIVGKRCRKKPRAQRSYVGTELDRLVKEKKRQAILELQTRIEVRGRRKDGTFATVKLKPRLQATVLGHRIRGDGDTLPDIKLRTGLARGRFNSLFQFWSNKSLKTDLKLSYYLRLITSVLCWGSEAWKLTDTAQRALNGFNARCVSVITGKSSRKEASERKRTIDIVGVIRYRRRQYLGHILRSNPASVLRRDVLQYAELVRLGELDGQGGILMDVLDDNGQATWDSPGELLSMAGCYDYGDAEEDRAKAHSQWTLASKELMADCDRERMRHTSAADTPANRKANTPEQTAAELAAVEHELRIYSDGGCDGNGAGGKWGASGWGVHVSLVLADGSLEEMADLWGPVETQEASPWFMGAVRGTNQTGELSGLGQSLYWLRDVDNTTRAVVILYDSMWAYNMLEGNWTPAYNVAMVRRLQRVLAEVRRTRDVYFVHVKSHQDDGVPLHDISDQAVLGNIRADKLVGWGKRPGPYCRLFDGGGEGDSIRVPSPLWAPFWAEELRKSRAKVAAVNRDGSGAQISAGAGRTTDVGASRRTTDGQADGYDEGTLDDAELAEMEELDQEMRMLAELEEAERARDVALPCELTSSDEEEGRNEDEETLALHALEAAAKARASPSSLPVGSDDLRAMEMAMREDSDTRASAPRTSGVDVRGLTAATERWSAAEPAADGAFRTPSQVCEFVILPGVTGESRDRS